MNKSCMDTHCKAHKDAPHGYVLSAEGRHAAYRDGRYAAVYRTHPAAPASAVFGPWYASDGLSGLQAPEMQVVRVVWLAGWLAAAGWCLLVCWLSGS